MSHIWITSLDSLFHSECKNCGLKRKQIDILPNRKNLFVFFKNGYFLNRRPGCHTQTYMDIFVDKKGQLKFII